MGEGAAIRQVLGGETLWGEVAEKSARKKKQIYLRKNVCQAEIFQEEGAEICQGEGAESARNKEQKSAREKKQKSAREKAQKSAGEKKRKFEKEQKFAKEKDQQSAMGGGAEIRQEKK
jgi:hypothetical protein